MQCRQSLLLGSWLGGNLLSSLGGLADLVNLGHGLDDTDGNGLTHVTDGKTTEWWVLGESLDAHWLGWHKLDNGGITRLDGLGEGLKRLAGTTVNLLDDLVELAGNVSSVAIQHWGVSVVDLTWVVQDDDLSAEALATFGWVVLGVTADHATTNLLHGETLDVESDVVTWKGLSEGLVVHLDRLDLSGEHSWRELHDHAWLQDTGLNTADWHCADTTNLVHVLEWKTEWLVRWAAGWENGIQSLEKGLAGGIAVLAGNFPSLEPCHLQHTK